MDEFELYLYLYYCNGMNPSPKIEMKSNPRSADPVQVNKFLCNSFGRNSARLNKEFNCFFGIQDPLNPVPARKLHQNQNFYPFLEQILSVFRF